MDAELDRLMAETLPPPDISRQRVQRVMGAVMARLDERAPPGFRPLPFLSRLSIPFALALVLGIVTGLAQPAAEQAGHGLAQMASTVYDRSVRY